MYSGHFARASLSSPATIVIGSFGPRSRAWWVVVDILASKPPHCKGAVSSSVCPSSPEGGEGRSSISRSSTAVPVGSSVFTTRRVGEAGGAVAMVEDGLGLGSPFGVVEIIVISMGAASSTL